ncbi:hypothetical protein CARN8_1720012 [mine drainage metagenome]|jgi:hypothetical protein|uniref:Uncharacterized protein n=1 Tax=mine drainage metagenome TaxID=410659 RepID=A0A3P3ZMC0_9ZZZZ
MVLALEKKWNVRDFLAREAKKSVRYVMIVNRCCGAIYWHPETGEIPGETWGSVYEVVIPMNSSG